MTEELGIGSRVRHPQFGDGVVINVKSNVYVIVFSSEGKKELSRSQHALEIIEAVEPPDGLISTYELERTLTEILKRWSDVQETVTLGSKWTGGKLILKPGDPNMASKEIPIDGFFHKIVMLRDRLRVLEQRINAHDKLDDEDKVNMQQYITRIYGSLTTFNILFKLPSDQFVGEKGKSE
jgi:hypothetical protein